MFVITSYSIHYTKLYDSELYSTSGEYDLLMKLYVESDDLEDIGKLVNEKIAAIPGVLRSMTTLAFKAF